jgi:hypothetical protein
MKATIICNEQSLIFNISITIKEKKSILKNSNGLNKWYLKKMTRLIVRGLAEYGDMDIGTLKVIVSKDTQG